MGTHASLPSTFFLPRSSRVSSNLAISSVRFNTDSLQSLVPTTMAASRLLGTATTMLLVSYAMAATSCNLAVARNEDSFLESYTLPTRTSTAYPGSRTSGSTYDDNFYLPTIPTSNPGLDRNLQIIQDAQDAVDIIGGPGRKRDAGLKCADGDFCVDGGASMTPYCINVETGHWYGMTGYSGSVTTGDYYDPEGERGNLYDGPCPGDLYSDRSSGGCARVVNSVPPNDPATSLTSTIGEATPSPMPNMTASGSVDSVSAAESGRPTNETTAGVTPYTGAASSLSTFALSICITGTAVLALLA